MMLRIYRITSVVLLALLALMPLLFRRHIIFATSATVVLTLVLMLITFQVQRLRMLARMIAKLDDLLNLLRNTKHELSSTESKRLQQELSEIRAELLGPVRLGDRAANKVISQHNMSTPAPNITTICNCLTSVCAPFHDYVLDHGPKLSASEASHLAMRG